MGTHGKGRAYVRRWLHSGAEDCMSESQEGAAGQGPLPCWLAFCRAPPLSGQTCGNPQFLFVCSWGLDGSSKDTPAVLFSESTRCVCLGEGWINKGAECRATRTGRTVTVGQVQGGAWHGLMRGTEGNISMRWMQWPCGGHYTGTGGHTSAKGHCLLGLSFP